MSRVAELIQRNQTAGRQGNSPAEQAVDNARPFARVRASLTRKHMPNTKSAARRMRNSARKQARNNIVRTQLKTAVKKFRASVETKQDNSPAALRAAISTLDKAVKKGVIKRGTADRKKSRLAIALNKATAAKK